tara:strand:- start:516 stop:737 length:222 start_codon:yes stop_codon:yes gene_type:complete
MVLANQELSHWSCKDIHQLAFVHDELQYECPSYMSMELGFLLELTATQAGEYYKMRCPVAAESKSGTTWADVH